MSAQRGHDACPLTPQERQRWGNVGLLGATALLLAYAETFVPIPLPGVRLGLANVAVLVALAQGDIPGAFCVALIKVLAQGLLFGSPLTMVYSLAGTLLSFAGMAPLSRLRTMRLAMVSVVGALLHQLGQLAVAAAILATPVIWYAAPLLLLASCVTGAVCGVLAEKVQAGFLAAQRPAAEEARDADGISPRHDAAGQPQDESRRRARPRRSGWAVGALVSLCVVVLHLGEPVPLAAIAVLVAALDARSFARLMPMLASVGLLTWGLQYLVDPTWAAREALVATLRLAAIAGASRALIARVPADELTATVSYLLAPLTERGVRTQGFLYAFDVAVRTLPTLTELVRSEFAARDGAGLTSVVTELVGKLWADPWGKDG